jgi:hypothetical protein
MRVSCLPCGNALLPANLHQKIAWAVALHDRKLMIRIKNQCLSMEPITVDESLLAWKETCVCPPVREGGDLDSKAESKVRHSFHAP